MGARWNTWEMREWWCVRLWVYWRQKWQVNSYSVVTIHSMPQCHITINSTHVILCLDWKVEPWNWTLKSLKTNHQEIADIEMDYGLIKLMNRVAGVVQLCKMLESATMKHDGLIGLPIFLSNLSPSLSVSLRLRSVSLDHSSKTLSSCRRWCQTGGIYVSVQSMQFRLD